MKNNIMVSSILLSVFLSGCGGGGGETPPPPRQGLPPSENIQPQAFESFTDTSRFPGSHVYNFIGNIGYLYNLQDCRPNVFNDTYVVVYNNGTAEMTNNLTLNGSVWATEDCIVAKAFIAVKAKDGDVNAYPLGSDYTYYDQGTKTFFQIDYPYDSGKIVSITNDGMAAVLQNPDGTQQNTKLIRAFNQVDMSGIGIAPQIAPLFNQDNPSDVLEQGFVDHDYNKPYVIKGNFYLYNVQGVNFSSWSADYYVIYNDKKIAVQKYDKNTQSMTSAVYGLVTDVYERIQPVNQEQVNAQYVSDYTFYDSVKKYFYEVNHTISGTSMLVDITNDGYSGILQDGRVVSIVLSYKKTEEK